MVNSLGAAFGVYILSCIHMKYESGFLIDRFKVFKKRTDEPRKITQGGLKLPIDDIERLKEEYARRAKDPGNDYSPANPVQAFLLTQRLKALQALLREHHLQDLSSLRILEIGCGSGGVLREFIQLGANACNLFGIDLLSGRLKLAHSLIPLANLSNADGQRLPYLPEIFDLVVQFTAFSSILDPQVKQNMAAEMLRVLKPRGALIWYDFWWNPTNIQTKGVRFKEIRTLFPGCSFKIRRITLAPPIARKVVPISLSLAKVLESFRIFNSHYLVLIRKNNS